MKSILDILENKKQQLIASGNPFSVQFTIDEINQLADINQLRALKLHLQFPKDFTPSPDLLACTQSILAGDDYYRVLEFCILKNRVLYLPVHQVFQKIVRD